MELNDSDAIAAINVVAKVPTVHERDVFDLCSKVSDHPQCETFAANVTSG